MTARKVTTAVLEEFNIKKLHGLKKYTLKEPLGKNGSLQQRTSRY